MIQLHPSESSQAERTQAARPQPGHMGQLLGSDQYVAGRSRVNATDGTSLHYRAWLPAYQPVSGALVFVHGIASHGAWFAQTASLLASEGIAVYAPDRRGSGLSGGQRGHADSAQQLLTDLDRVVTVVELTHPATPVFLVGSSWAAKLAVAYAARMQARLAGLVLHGPGLFPKVDLTIGQKLLVLAAQAFQPGRQLPIPLTPESYTNEPEHLEYIRQDGYRLLTASARFFWETHKLDRLRTRSAARLTLPILLQIGAADPIMDAAATCDWLNGLRAPDRTAITYRNASHTLDFESEPTVRAYRADLLTWLRRQIGQDVTRRLNQQLNGEPTTEASNGR